MKLDDRLVDAAKALAAARFPRGWAGAAAMYTASGALLTSVYVDAPHEGVTLCCEAGCICEAHKLDDAIVATVCVGREDERSPWEILAPCGVCMERLAWWGPDVECAVPADGDPSRWADAHPAPAAAASLGSLATAGLRAAPALARVDITGGPLSPALPDRASGRSSSVSSLMLEPGQVAATSSSATSSGSATSPRSAHPHRLPVAEPARARVVRMHDGVIEGGDTRRARWGSGTAARA
jgi:cytidine deaminase